MSHQLQKRIELLVRPLRRQWAPGGLTRSSLACAAVQFLCREQVSESPFRAHLCLGCRPLATGWASPCFVISRTRALWQQALLMPQRLFVAPSQAFEGQQLDSVVARILRLGSATLRCKLNRQ